MRLSTKRKKSLKASFGVIKEALEKYSKAFYILMGKRQLGTGLNYKICLCNLHMVK